MEGEGGVNCLFCYSSIDFTKPGEVDSIGFSTYEALEVTFAELCSLLQISFPSKWKSWDFENEPFPFCNQCHGEIATVCDLSDQVKLIQKSLKSILLHLTATALQSVKPGKESTSVDKISGGLPHPPQRTVPGNKYEFFRESVIKSYSPVLMLQPLKGTSASRSLIKPLTVNSHDKTAEAEHEDSDGSYCVDTDPFDDVPDLFEPSVTVKVEDALSVLDNSSNCLEEDPPEERAILTTNQQRKRPVKAEIKLVDEATKTYSFSGYKFQEVNSNFKCLTCSQVRACVKNQKKGTNAYYEYITRHITRTHIEPKTPVKRKAKTASTNKLTPAKRGINQITSYVPILPRVSTADLSFKSEENESHSKFSVKQVILSITEDADQAVDTGSHDFRSIQDPGDPPDPDCDFSPAEEAPEISDDDADSDSSDKCPKTRSKRSPRKRISSQDDASTTDANRVFNTRAGKVGQNPKIPSTKRVPRHEWVRYGFKLLDEDTETYSMEGYKFQELENTFKCLTCGKEIKINSGTGIRRFEFIKKHLRCLHIDPKKPVATIVDRETKTYSTLGFQFQQVDTGDFRCLVCGHVIKAFIRRGKNRRSRFTHIKHHMARMHVAVIPEKLHDTEENTEAHNFWKEFEASTPSAPKTDASENSVGAEEDSLAENNSSSLDPQPAVKQELVSSAGNFVIRPDHGLEVLDESQKVFSLYDCKFRELAQGYECGTCFKILGFAVVEKKERRETESYKARQVPRQTRIKKHIMELHVDPSRRKRAVGPSTLVDASANIHDYQGFQFQGINGQYRCLKCKELGSSSAETVYSRVGVVQRHIWKDHIRDKMPARVRLVNQEMKIYTYKQCEFVDSGEGGHECVICKAVRHTWASMVDHIDQEHKEPVERQCTLCPWKYKMTKRLTSHIRLNHAEDRTKPVCETCGRSYLNQESLNKHVKHMHGERPHACKQCDKKYAQAANLRKHILTFHEDVRSCVCEVCGKGFFDASALRSHQEIHASDKPYICDQCGKAFAQKNGLKKHIRAVHQGHKLPHKFPCDICGKKFQASFSVKVHHREVHLGIRPKRIRDSRTRKTIRTIKPQQSLDESIDAACN